MTDERERLIEKMAVAFRDKGLLLPENSKFVGEAIASAALSVIEQAGGYAPEGKLIVSATPDNWYNPDNWYATYPWDGEFPDGLSEELSESDDEILRIETLIRGPDKFVCDVPVAFDKDGYVVDTEMRIFNTRDEAESAMRNAEKEG